MAEGATARERIASLLVSGKYVLAPEVLLALGGPIKDGILAVSAGEIRLAGRKPDFEKDTPGVAAMELPGKGIIPGMIDPYIMLVAAEMAGARISLGQMSQESHLVF